MTTYEVRPSGLAVPKEKPATPPEHTLRPKIRALLQQLADACGEYEQTTHGALRGGGGIYIVTEALIRAYDDPRAYTISDLQQKIGYFLEYAKPDKPI